MLPEPLHAAVVHFPMALVILLPLFALGALWVIRRGSTPRRAWAVPLLLAAALTVSAWVALQTGEAEEDRVEAVVSESVLHRHEEAAERFLVLSGVLLVVAAGGMLGGTLGRSARLVATVGAFGLVLSGLQVGAAGGELVYRHGAANAYLEAVPGEARTSGTGAAIVRPAEREEDDEDSSGRSPNPVRR